MSASPETPTWATREYWGGVSVDAPSTINVAKRPVGPLNSVQHAAIYVLETALEGVLRGDYQQKDAVSWGGFDPKAEELEGGAVVLLERERLSRMSYNPGWTQPANEELGSLPHDTAEFAEYWRENSTEIPPMAHVEHRSFGETGSELSYQRSLQWGVLVPHLSKEVVFTWDTYDFSDSTDIQNGIVSFRPGMQDLNMLPTPITVGRAEATRRGRKNIVIPRSIERTTAVSVVEAEGAVSYRNAYEGADAYSTLAANLPIDPANLYRGAEIMIAGFLGKS